MTTQIPFKPNLDARLVNPLINATVDVLSTIAHAPVQMKQIEAHADYQAGGDISAVIGILYAEGEGMATLSFPLRLANLVVARLIGSPNEHFNAEERSDGIGELVNMISGSAKTSLAEKGEAAYSLTLPSIILGTDHQICSRPKGNPYLTIAFDCEGETFTLQLTFKKALAS